MNEVMNEISARMRTYSIPWHTAGRYWGHMNTETLMPSILAYNFAMLWNGNNVAYESSQLLLKWKKKWDMNSLI